MAGRTNATGGAYKWLVLAILICIGLTNYMDRLSINILQVDIKRDLALSDTEMGAVTGLSFSLIYTLAALPIARFADRYSPKLVIIISLLAWNVMTMLCAFANGFGALALFRMGVAIGESGAGPATQSLLARHFPAAQRGRAIAIWQMVFPLGSLFGIGLGGALGAALGWRRTFIVLGAVGIALAPIVAVLLKERSLEPRARSKAAPGIGRGLPEVLASPAMRRLLAGGFIAAIPLNATLTWNALFYARVYDLTAGGLALGLALVSGLGGAAGMLAGGFLGDRLGRRDVRAYCWLPALGLAVAPALALAQYVGAASPATSMAFGLGLAVLLNAWMPPQAAIAQSLVTADNRALAAACILVTAGLGAAVGVFFTGVCSDLLAGRLPANVAPLRVVLPGISLLSLVAAGLFLWAAKFLQGDLRDFDASINVRPTGEASGTMTPVAGA